MAKSLVLTFLALNSIAASAHAQRVHEVTLEANAQKDTYRFQPATVNARPGDVVLFKVSSGAPHSIVFESGGMSESAHEALNGAMARRAGDLSSPLLTGQGSQYRLVVPQIPTGVYSFYCLPHRAYDMRGQLRVTK